MNSIRILKDLIEKPNDRYVWSALVEAMHDLISKPLSRESEQVLISVLRLQQPIDVEVGPDGPHRMSPDDMLNSLAVQALVRWTGLIYLTDLQRLMATTRSPELAGIIGHVLREAKHQARDRGSFGVLEHPISFASSDDFVADTFMRERGLTFVTNIQVPQRDLQPTS